MSSYSSRDQVGILKSRYDYPPPTQVHLIYLQLPLLNSATYSVPHLWQKPITTSEARQASWKPVSHPSSQPYLCLQSTRTITGASSVHNILAWTIPLAESLDSTIGHKPNGEILELTDAIMQMYLKDKTEHFTQTQNMHLMEHSPKLTTYSVTN